MLYLHVLILGYFTLAVIHHNLKPRLARRIWANRYDRRCKHEDVKRKAERMHYPLQIASWALKLVDWIMLGIAIIVAIWLVWTVGALLFIWLKETAPILSSMPASI